jgi:hypothetical protein
MGEKCRSTPRVTIHKRPENNKLCLQIVHNRLRKRPYALCKSCRGSRDLQLWYSSFSPLQFNFLEKNKVKACQFELFWPWPSRARAGVTRRRAVLLGPHAEAAFGPSVRAPGDPHAPTDLLALSSCATCRARKGRDALTPHRPTSSVAVYV